MEKMTVVKADGTMDTQHSGAAKLLREKIAKRAAKEVKNGMYINLGIGIPTLSTNFLDPKLKVTFHSENGILGMGGYPTAD